MSHCDWWEQAFRRPVPGGLFAHLRCSVCWGIREIIGSIGAGPRSG